VTAYQKVTELHDEDEPPFMHHNEYRDSEDAGGSKVESSSESYQLGRLYVTPYVPEEHPPE
jgi:hypothetical protein